MSGIPPGYYGPPGGFPPGQPPYMAGHHFPPQQHFPQQMQHFAPGQPPPSLFEERPPSHPPQFWGQPPPFGRQLGDAEAEGHYQDQQDEDPSGTDWQQDPGRLPSSIERVLAYKAERARETGVDIDQLDRDSAAAAAARPPLTVGLSADSAVEVSDEEEGDDEASSFTNSSNKDALAQKMRNKKKKLKKKKSKGKKREPEISASASAPEAEKEQHEISSQEKDEKRPSAGDEGVEIEYVPESIDIPLNVFDPNYQHFVRVFDSFKLTKEEENEEERDAKEKAESMERLAPKAKAAMAELEALDEARLEKEANEENNQSGDAKMSKKKWKKINRMTVAQLKQSVLRPDLVEWHDITSRDPTLLLHLKAARNTVPVPRHWCLKRKYLQGKRGFVKPPFELPECIRMTGIQDMREAVLEKDDKKTLKAKMRERVRPKMGKIEIDYQKLHDAFFRYQTKPPMSQHGDLYYEGKEMETKLREKKPGNLSEELRVALGMPVGTNKDKFPPPWLIAMQRYGPPPSYPNLKIAGLNAPIPEGCAFGYHAGGWGKPPVDEFGRPLYGDVFGQTLLGMGVDGVVDFADGETRRHWGELEEEEEEEEDMDDDEDEAVERPLVVEREKNVDSSGLATPATGYETPAGLVTPSGSGVASTITTTGRGIETPGDLELRKRPELIEGGDTPSLYKVVPEKRVNVGSGLMGTTHVYDIGGAKKGADGDVEVALNPEELDDLEPEALQARYDKTVREQRDAGATSTSGSASRGDTSQKSKRKSQQPSAKEAEASSASEKDAKRYKQFKF